jgi:hypothetical protein
VTLYLLEDVFLIIKKSKNLKEKHARAKISELVRRAEKVRGAEVNGGLVLGEGNTSH